MSRQLNELYQFYRQLGADFTDESAGNKQIRSLNFDFGIVKEHVTPQHGQVHLDVAMYTPYGNKTYEHLFSSGETSADFLHQHDYFELMYVLSGTVNVRIESAMYQYQAGDACLINCHTRHMEQYDCSNSVVYFCIAKSLARRLIPDIQKYHISADLESFFYHNIEQESIYSKEFMDYRANGNQPPEASWESAERLTGHITSEMKTRYPGYTLVIHALLLRMMFLLSNPAFYNLHICQLDAATDEQLLEQFHAFVAERNGQINRKELSSAFHFHPDYLNTVIKKQTGLSLIQFAQNYRMQEAARQIRYSEMSITDICQTLGFINKPYFYRLFKRTYQMTPTEYRTFHQKQ